MGNGGWPQGNGQHHRSRKDLEDENRRLRDENERLRQEAAKGSRPVDWEPIIQGWYRDLSKLYHPDRGGSVEQMQAVNEAHDRLRKLVGV
jgi:hypothetical protein